MFSSKVGITCTRISASMSFLFSSFISSTSCLWLKFLDSLRVFQKSKDEERSWVRDTVPQTGFIQLPSTEQVLYNLALIKHTCTHSFSDRGGLDIWTYWQDEQPDTKNWWLSKYKKALKLCFSLASKQHTLKNDWRCHVANVLLYLVEGLNYNNIIKILLSFFNVKHTIECFVFHFQVRQKRWRKHLQSCFFFLRFRTFLCVKKLTWIGLNKRNSRICCILFQPIKNNSM